MPRAAGRPRAASWVLADMTTGRSWRPVRRTRRLLPASTLKTLTALTLIPTVPADRRIVATAADVRADGTRVGMLPGSSYTAGQLFQGLLMASGNDAAYALARVGGGAGGVPQTLRCHERPAPRSSARSTPWPATPPGWTGPGRAAAPTTSP